MLEDRRKSFPKKNPPPSEAKKENKKTYTDIMKGVFHYETKL